MKIPGKRERTKLVKAELYMNLAVMAKTWEGYAEQDEKDLKAGNILNGDDTLVKLAVKYGLRPRDIARVCRQLGKETERKAMNLGYENHWEANE